MAIAPAPIASPPEPGIPSTPPPEPPLAPALTVSPEPTVASGTPVLQCIGLRKRFGDRQAVDGVGFGIAPGETYGLLGPNGAGKTTTISMVCGILRRDEGEVLIGGRPLDPRRRHSRPQIGYVPQDLAIYPGPERSARTSTSSAGCTASGVRPSARVDEVLAIVDLADRARERTSSTPAG